MKDLVLKVSELPSQSLLRAIDVIGDNGGNPYFLEAQTLPGNPGGITYPLIAQLPFIGLVYSHGAAVHVLSEHFSHLLQINQK